MKIKDDHKDGDDWLCQLSASYMPDIVRSIWGNYLI